MFLAGVIETASQEHDLLRTHLVWALDWGRGFHPKRPVRIELDPSPVGQAATILSPVRG